MTDECGAPEFYGAGLKLIGLTGKDGKLSPEQVGSAIERYSGHVPHQVNAGSLSLTQASEGRNQLPGGRNFRVRASSRMRTGLKCTSTARASAMRWLA